jgi:type I restriction enzyme S subunit
MSSDARESCLGAIISEDQAELQTGPFGTMLKAEEYSDEGAPVISVGEIREGYLEIGARTPRVSGETIKRLPRFLLKENDIVFGRKGSTHRNALIKKGEEGYFLGSDGIRLRVNSKSICPKYLSYQLRSSKAVSWLKSNSEGTTMPSLNQDILSRFPITLLPIADQKAIAHILGTLDDKIELNRKTNETLESMAKALFKSWFVDFDPVRAKAEGRSTGLPDEISDLFPDSFEESELGEIPRGWKVTQLGDHIDLIKGRSYKSNELKPSSTALVTLKSFQRNGGYRTDGLKQFTGEYKEQQIVKPGELVIALTDVTQAADVIGRPAIVKSDSHCSTLVASLDVGIIRPRASGLLSTPYLYFLMLTQGYVQHVLGYTSGTTVLHLAKDAASRFIHPIGAFQILENFSRLSDSILRQVDASARQSELLSKTRDSLLPKLISGEIRIPDAERMLEEAGV